MGQALNDYLGIVKGPEDEWDLFEIALQLCRVKSSNLDSDAYTKRVSELCRRVEDRLAGKREAFEIISCLNDVLFQEEGFQGNAQDYYNANNSYLTFVLDQKKGIPISLAILYRQVAVHFGLSLQCVAMPGHFLLKYSAPFHQLFIDPFHRGEILLEQECEQRFLEVHGGQAEFERDYLNETSNRVVVLRMLMNLKQAYRRSGNNPLLLQILDRRLPLLEEALPETLERGLVRLDLEQYSGALDDLEFFVQNSQDAKVKKLIEERLPQVRLLARRN